MLKKSNHTNKIYYLDQYIKSHDSNITDINENFIILNKTILYPEGGGQESDKGWIETPVGVIQVDYVKLLNGNPIHLKGFKGGFYGGVIAHYFSSSNKNIIDHLRPGMSVRIHLDVERRQRLTLSHSASHFLYAAIITLRPELEDQTIGCHIKEDSARFDFYTESSFDSTSISVIESYANEMISQNNNISIIEHPEVPEARIWTYEDIRIPCGGTHLRNPKDIGYITVKRKNIGKNKERIICSFSEAIFNTEKYH